MNEGTYYHEQESSLRVIKRGRFWFFQKFMGGKGQNKSKSVGHYDPWQDDAPPTETRDAAIYMMHTRKPIRKDF